MRRTPEPAEPDPKWGRPDATHDPWVLAHFQALKSDVLITTAPKAGTTWMQQILYQMQTGGDADFDNIDNVVPWLERPRAGKTWQQVLNYYDTLPRPRIFKTHCTAEQTPGIGTASIILTLRDPRDCCVSFFHHIMNMTDSARDMVGLECPHSFADHVDSWLEAGAWYRNVTSWWPYRNHEKILILRFQDLKYDLEGSIDSITTFLGWQLTTDHKAIAARYSSFEWMKAHNEKFSPQIQTGRQLFKPGKFIREGKTGGYKELMSHDLEQKILDRTYKELEPECLRFLEIDN